MDDQPSEHVNIILSPHSSVYVYVPKTLSSPIVSFNVFVVLV